MVGGGPACSVGSRVLLAGSRGKNPVVARAGDGEVAGGHSRIRKDVGSNRSVAVSSRVGAEQGDLVAVVLDVQKATVKDVGMGEFCHVEAP